MASCPPPDFATKRRLWLEALSGEDRHTVMHQLVNLTLDASIFRLISEARSLAPAASEGHVKLNGLVHSLVDRGFFALHATGIRRLMDRGELEGEKGVYSLRALLIDMEKHAHLFTRKAILEAEGLAYDYTPIKQKKDEFLREKILSGASAWNIPMELEWQFHEHRHQEIDIFSGKNPENRQPEDTINGAVFSNLLDKASSHCSDLSTFATKFIAHAATPESRSCVGADGMSFHLDQMWSALRQLCQMTVFLNTRILGDKGRFFLPIFQGDLLQYIDRPLVKTSDKERLKEVWHDLAKDCESWSGWGLDEYHREFYGS